MEEQSKQNQQRQNPTVIKAPIAAQDENFKHIIRVGNTDLDGNKRIYSALRKIKGINFMYANMLCNITNTDKYKKAGYLNEKEVELLDDALRNPHKFHVPFWMINRRKDYETGEDKHLLGGDLKFSVDNDIRRVKKIKAYKGVRHMLGQPVRGQRTRSNFRRNKGKVMGVQRSKIAAPSSDKKDDNKK